MVLTGKRLVRFFVSYAHDDRKLVESFLREVRKQVSGAARYTYELWVDGQIALGARWRVSIDRAIHACDFGMVLVSPSLLGSEFIQEHELPHFIGERITRPIVPVGLAKVDWRDHDLRGLEEAQIFLKDGRRFYGEMRNAQEKGVFAFELFGRLQELLDSSFGVSAAS